MCVLTTRPAEAAAAVVKQITATVAVALAVEAAAEVTAAAAEVTVAVSGQYNSFTDPGPRLLEKVGVTSPG